MTRPPANLTTLLRQGRFIELEAIARRMIASNPDDGNGWKALGAALSGIGQAVEALAAKQRAVQLMPDDAEAHRNLANSLLGAQQVDEAIKTLKHVVRLRPTADAFLQLGALLRQHQRMHEAVEWLGEAVRLRPMLYEAWNNLGTTYHDLGRLPAAEAALRQALAHAPGIAEIHSNLGNVLRDLERHAEAISCYESALALNPQFLGAANNLMLALNYQDNISPEVRRAKALMFGKLVAQRVQKPISHPKQAEVSAVGYSPPPLRVGLVSGDFRNHPVGYFLEGMLRHIDRRRLSLWAYPTNEAADAMTVRLSRNMAAWRPITNLDDEAAARLIFNDEIDILIDLSGHTAHNRLGLFAWRPAPVQASWLGYFGTTGVQAIDYLLADSNTVPVTSTEFFTEKIWRLPKTRLCFTPPQDAPDVSVQPLLSRGYVTFGCFQSLAKINEPVLRAWANVLRQTTGSRLRIQSPQLGDEPSRKQLADRMVVHGIDMTRVSLHGRTSRMAYLAAHAEVDILLDTFPYPGGTTTCEALWMGVPTVTLAGNRLISRQGCALLEAAEMSDWIATDVDDYVARAVSFAKSPTTLAQLRACLRQQVSSSALCNAAAFATDFTAALEQIHQSSKRAAVDRPRPPALNHESA